MAVTPKPLVRQKLAGSNGTLYTVPASTTAIVTSIVACNTDSVTRTVTLIVGGQELLYLTPVDPGSPLVVDVRQPLTTGQTITGSASTGSVVAIHIGGTETA